MSLEDRYQAYAQSHNGYFPWFISSFHLRFPKDTRIGLAFDGAHYGYLASANSFPNSHSPSHCLIQSSHLSESLMPKYSLFSYMLVVLLCPLRLQYLQKRRWRKMKQRGNVKERLDLSWSYQSSCPRETIDHPAMPWRRCVQMLSVNDTSQGWTSNLWVSLMYTRTSFPL
jgi:hypothetical protein